MRNNPKAMRQPPSPYDESLAISALAWLKELPPEAVPVLLVNRFPRIVNRLARFWDSPQMIDAYFEDLLVDPCGKRQGFPDEVLAEIYALAQYHRALRKPLDIDVWEQARALRASDG
ncbi:MAG TPA: hypothetical protein VGM15_15185 [Burkholderiaceae bacterium]|jgi:hypothetical protein